MEIIAAMIFGYVLGQPRPPAQIVPPGPTTELDLLVAAFGVVVCIGILIWVGYTFISQEVRRQRPKSAAAVVNDFTTALLESAAYGHARTQSVTTRPAATPATPIVQQVISTVSERDARLAVSERETRYRAQNGISAPRWQQHQQMNTEDDDRRRRMNTAPIAQPPSDNTLPLVVAGLIIASALHQDTPAVDEASTPPSNSGSTSSDSNDSSSDSSSSDSSSSDSSSSSSE